MLASYQGNFKVTSNELSNLS